MFIELTDQLRCPADHPESFLIMLPAAMEERSVMAGELGCPVCGRIYRVTGGVADLRLQDAPPLPAGTDSASALDADGLTALLGLNGPGGWMVLVGEPARRWGELLERVPGVAPVAVNPPEGIPVKYPLSSLLSGRIPLRSRSMRAVVLGPGYGEDGAWVAEAARVALPGLRVVGQGQEPDIRELELLASADGVWVASRASG
jgi:uncharacterized protein YbaR (Trm112 family)